jgi:hypothetical protein
METRPSIKTHSPGRERTVTSSLALWARARIRIIPTGLPRGLPGFGGGSGGEAPVVVLNGEADLSSAGFQFDFHAPGRGAARRVCQGILGDAKQVRLRLIGKAAGAHGCESRLDAGARPGAPGPAAEMAWLQSQSPQPTQNSVVGQFESPALAALRRNWPGPFARTVGLGPYRAKVRVDDFTAK